MAETKASALISLFPQSSNRWNAAFCWPATFVEDAAQTALRKFAANAAGEALIVGRPSLMVTDPFDLGGRAFAVVVVPSRGAMSGGAQGVTVLSNEAEFAAAELPTSKFAEPGKIQLRDAAANVMPWLSLAQARVCLLFRRVLMCKTTAKGKDTVQCPCIYDTTTGTHLAFDCVLILAAKFQ